MTRWVFTEPGLLAAIPPFLLEVGMYAGFAVVVGCVYLVGNRFLGKQYSGGKRLVLFLVGVSGLAITWGISTSDGVPLWAKVAVGAVLGLSGLYVSGVGLFGSPKAVDRMFGGL